MSTGFLANAYKLETREDTRDLYDAWAKTYDEEIAKNGYATPERCAAALKKYTTDMAAPVLDFGCGTGISGAALSKFGFETFDGVDISADMLAGARARAIYRSLRQIGFDEAPVDTPGTYAAIAAMGVIGTGAAPAQTFDTLIHALTRGGKFVFSFNDHTLEDPAFEGRISEWTDCGAARLLFREHGPHLPGIDLHSTVYVIERT